MVHRTIHGTPHMPLGINPQNKNGMNLRHSRFPPKNQHTKNFLRRCNNSCRTGFNSCTKYSSTYKPTNYTRKCRKISVEIHSGAIWKSNLPSSTSEGACQGGIPRKLQQVNQEETQIKNSSQSN